MAFLPFRPIIPLSSLLIIILYRKIRCIELVDLRFRRKAETQHQRCKYNPQIEMFARFKMKSSFHKTKRII